MCSRRILHLQKYFNPRSHEGSDADQAALDAALTKFQSTLPRRERRYLAIHNFVKNFHFNPRSHEGSDDVRAILFEDTNISIHAPTKGATICSHISPTACRFQSTLPRRERRGGDIMAKILIGFQSTLPRRERPERPGKPEAGSGISIHAPTKGATKNLYMTMQRSVISIHAPTKGATANNSLTEK